MSPPPTAAGARFAQRSTLQRAIGVAWLAGLVILTHGWSLTYGLFMDDNAQFAQLREASWSLRDLTDACRLELFGDHTQAWWMPECTLRFFRPVAFALLKATYGLGQWDLFTGPLLAHGVSLLLHLTVCGLSYALIMRLGLSPLAAIAAASLFAVHPAHVATVQWIAAQNELLVTALLIGALLSYLHARGGFASPALRGAAQLGPGARWPSAALSLTLFALALGCRENAVLFPVVLLIAEPFVMRQRSRAGWGLLAGMFMIVPAYLLTRSAYLGGVALPPRPYVVPPDAPDFVMHVFDKACYYLLAEFLALPCVPLGGLNYFRDNALLFYGLTLAVLVLAAAACLNRRFAAAGVIAPAWLLLLMAPVLPAFEAPHHLYLPGVGWTVMAALLLERLRALARTPAWQAGLATGVTALGLAVLGLLAHFYSLSLDTAQRVEDRLIDEIARAPRPVRDGDTLYLFNTPLITHFVKYGVENRTGLRDLRVVLMTWSPRLLGMVTQCELRRVDADTLDLLVAEDRYFSGPLGRLAREASGRAVPVTADAPARAHGLTVELLAGDTHGAAGLRFHFAHALTAPQSHVFFGSRTRWASQIDFQALPAAHAAPPSAAPPSAAPTTAPRQDPAP